MEDISLTFQEKSEETIKLRNGCYVTDQQLMDQHKDQFILAPLVSSLYELQIVNSIVNVSLQQVYYNPTNKFLQMEYNFPIDPDSCIYNLSAEFGNTRIQGVIKQKKEAKKEYKQALKQGKKSVYGEIDSDTRDIFTLNIGNIPPKSKVKIYIVYVHELSLANNIFYQLKISSNVSPRYLNFVPKEKVIKGLIGQNIYVPGNIYWDFRINLKTTKKIIFCDSYTHSLQLVFINDTRTVSKYTMTNSCIPNKDFALNYTTEEYHLPSYVLSKNDIKSTAMLSFIPKFCLLNIDDAYKASVEGKQIQTQIDNCKGQYIFFLDRSGSMNGSSIQKAKKALILFIKSIPQDSFFNVISFGSTSKAMYKQSVKYDNQQIKKAIKKIKNMSADLGGTQILIPLQQTLKQKSINGYPKHIFILTDGQVKDIEKVVHMVASYNKYSRIHTIGIGSQCSEQLIIECATKGKGKHIFINEQQNFSQKIIQLLSDSFSPVINQAKLIFDKNIVESIIPNPQSMPYILKNQIVNFYVTFKGHLQQQTSLLFTYEDSLNKIPYQTNITIDPFGQSESFIDKMAHFKKIRLLEQSYHSNNSIEDKVYFVKQVNKKDEVIAESIKYQILSEFTSFVSIEKQLIDGQFQQIKDKGQSFVIFHQEDDSKFINQSQFIKQSSGYGRGKGGKGVGGKRLIGSKSSGCFGIIPEYGSDSEQCDEQCDEDSFQESFSELEGQEEAEQKMQDRDWQKELSRAARFSPTACSKISKIIRMQQAVQKYSNHNYQKFLQCKQQLEQLISNYEGKNIKKKQTLQQMNKSLTIQKIVDLQSADGSWRDISMIGSLFGQQVQQKVAKQDDLIAVITYLISRWIDKYFSSKQYSLISKKGKKFAQKRIGIIKIFETTYDYLFSQ